MFDLLGEKSGQPAVETQATEPEGDPIEELALELVPMPCFLYTPLRLIACACSRLFSAACSLVAFLEPALLAAVAWVKELADVDGDP